MNESSLKKCPTCGAALDAENVSGCPRCLMLAALQPTQHTEGADRPPPPSLAAVSAAFPLLEVLELIGQGGMGCVFKARQPQLNRFVALKILPEALSRDAAFAARFTREAQALAALSHPNIVTIHDFGQAGGFFYLLMEFVDGVNLRQALRGGHFTPEQALAIVPPLCDALQFAHERGIVHRDIKPENLLLDKAGRIKVADFGIAKMLAAIGAAACEAPGPDSPSASATGKPPIPSFLTADNATAGTPGYMAPEQKATPQRVDSRADIYSLGVVLYEMLTGELPAEKLQPPSRKVQIDVRLDEIVLRALEKTPELRYQTAAELRTQVVTISEGAAPIPNAGQTEYVSSWGFRLTPGPAVKTGYVRFWERRFGSVESSGAINTLNLSRIGVIGCLALFAILPGWRWCWPTFGFLGMFVGIGAAYLSEAAARRGVDLSKTRGLPAEQSPRGVWRRRIVWLAIGGGVLPMAFFAFSLFLSLGRNGEKVIEAATTGQMAVVFAKIFAIGSGLTLLIWALLRTFWRNAAKAANPWLRYPEALVALTMLWPLLLMTAPFVIWNFVSAHRPPRDPMNAAEWIVWGLVIIFVVQGAVWFTRNLRQTLRAMNGECASPVPPADSRTQGEAAVSPREGGQPPRVLEAAQGFLFEPTQFATQQGRFLAYRLRGQLILDEQRLVYSRGGVKTTIPLVSVRDLSIGQYPRSVSPLSCDLISLTYQDGSELKQVLISPMEGWIGLPSMRNAFCAQWFVAIQEAVIEATGKAPSCTRPDQLGIPQGSIWPHVAMIALPLLVSALFLAVIIWRIAGGLENLAMFIAAFIVVTLGPLAYHFFMTNPNNNASTRPNAFIFAGSFFAIVGWIANSSPSLWAGLFFVAVGIGERVVVAFRK